MAKVIQIAVGPVGVYLLDDSGRLWTAGSFKSGFTKVELPKELDPDQPKPADSSLAEMAKVER